MIDELSKNIVPIMGAAGEDVNNYLKVSFLLVNAIANPP